MIYLFTYSFLSYLSSKELSQSTKLFPCSFYPHDKLVIAQVRLNVRLMVTQHAKLYTFLGVSPIENNGTYL